jgi:predicted Zn-dependent protease
MFKAWFEARPNWLSDRGLASRRASLAMTPEPPTGAERIIGAATGFCELGTWQAAWDELETLEPEERALPEVLRIRLGILVALERWEPAGLLAEGMIARGKDSPITWLHAALAIRRHRSIEKARTFLLRAEPSLQGHPSFHYSLAVYECLLGNLPAAKERLARAVRLNPGLQMVALEDEDLEPLW